MFDKKVYYEYDNNVPVTKNVNVTIGRAPTDESIRLYDEFKEKAYKSILESFHVTDNTFNFDAIVCRDCSSFNEKLKFRFFLNNKEYQGEVEIDNYGKNDIQKVYKKLSEKIAEYILLELHKKGELKWTN